MCFHFVPGFSILDDLFMVFSVVGVTFSFAVTHEGQVAMKAVTDVGAVIPVALAFFALCCIESCCGLPCVVLVIFFLLLTQLCFFQNRFQPCPFGVSLLLRVNH